MKDKAFDELITKLSICEKCTNLRKKNNTDCSLINIYKKESLAKQVPSIWTDWYHRLDSSLMIIGQDWGPYEDMKKLHEAYLKNPTPEVWIQLIESEKSLTKKMLTKFLIESAAYNKIVLNQEKINQIFITNAIMCARKNNHYRGNDIDLKQSTLNCSEYLKRQIEIVHPKVIVTLGFYPLFALSKIFSFSISKKLTEVIKETPIIKVNDYTIIPVYHPSSQIKKEVQLEQYKKIWENL